MKLHGSLGAERVAVRRSCNAGEGCRETHGLHGNMDKLYYAAVKWGHQALLTGIQKVYEKIRASVRFPANLCPACISGERHAERWSALPSDACQMAHRATVGVGHHRSTGNCKKSHRRGTWATSTSGSVRPPGSERENHRNPWGMQNMAPRRRYLTAHQYRNYQPTSVYKTLYIGQETAHHQGDSNDEAP
jgi:hypothetical protein